MAERVFHRVVVYGTLKEGLHNHRVLSKRGTHFFCGRHVIPSGFKMYDLGAFPALVKDKEGSLVHTEVYEVDDDTFKDLDTLEGFPQFYSRKLIPTPYGEGWVYYVEGRDMSNKTFITDGIWHSKQR